MRGKRGGLATWSGVTQIYIEWEQEEEVGQGDETEYLGSIKKLDGRNKHRANQPYLLTPRLEEPGGSMPISQGLSNNPYPGPNRPSSSC